MKKSVGLNYNVRIRVTYLCVIIVSHKDIIITCLCHNYIVVYVSLKVCKYTDETGEIRRGGQSFR